MINYLFTTLVLLNVTKFTIGANLLYRICLKVDHGTKLMEALSQMIKSAESETGLNISVICDRNKAFYAQNPKQVQRLPKQERAYWYWFLKHHRADAA